MEMSPFKSNPKFAQILYHIGKMGETWDWYSIDKAWLLHKIICCGCLLESPHRGDSNRYPQHMILRRTDGNFAKKTLITYLVYCKGFIGTETFM